MLRKVTAALCVAVVIAGCSHVRPCHPDTLGMDLDEVNRELTHRDVLLTTTDGQTAEAEFITLSAESLLVSVPPRLIDSQPTSRFDELTLPVSSVTRLELVPRNRARGFLEGALLGLCAGGVGGAALGAATHQRDCLTPNVGDSIAFGFVIFGVLGGAIGALLGVARGSSDVYDFTPPDSAERDT